MVGDQGEHADVAQDHGGTAARRVSAGWVAVVVGALAVAGLCAVGLRALDPFTDPYRRQPLLLVGPFDASAAQIALWALVWISATVVAWAVVVVVRRLARGRLRALVVTVPLLGAVGLGLVATGTLALLGVQWGLAPTYERLAVTDPDGRHWVVAEHANGFADATTWRVYRGGPFVYEEVPALEREAGGRFTPVADGEYSVRSGPDGTPVLRFTGGGPHEVPLH